MEEIILTPVQYTEAERVFEHAKARANVELGQAARMVALKKNSELFGGNRVPEQTPNHSQVPTPGTLSLVS